MNKKKIIIIGISIIIAIITLFFTNYHSTSKEEIALSEEIFNKINNKEDILIYVTDKFKNCSLCDDANKFIKFYQDTYGLKFIYYDKTKNSKKDFNNLTNQLGFEKDYITNPAVILIKEGEVKAVANEMIYEIDLKNFLLEYNFIDSSNNTQLMDDNFQDIYNSKDLSLVAFYTGSEDSYLFRKNLANLSKKYNFNYYEVYYGLYGSNEASKIVLEELQTNFNIPLLLVIKENKIIDYTTKTKEKELLTFLNKNILK